MRQSWWKILTVGLLMYTLVGGLLLEVPRLPILNETIRALHFHVTMWFGMILMLLVAAWNSVKYLRSNELSTTTLPWSLPMRPFCLGYWES